MDRWFRADYARSGPACQRRRGRAARLAAAWPRGSFDCRCPHLMIPRPSNAAVVAHAEPGGRMKSLRIALLLTLCSITYALAARPAAAQSEWSTGGYLLGSFPMNDWGKIAGFGTGLDATDILRFGQEKPFAWRLSTGVIYNFARTEDVPPANLLPTSKLELETKNWSLLFGIGPEIGKRTGEVQPFIYGTAGFDTYWTQSTLSGTAGGLPYESDHGDSRLSFAWAGGFGVRRVVSQGYRGEISLEYRSG